MFTMRRSPNQTRNKNATNRKKAYNHSPAPPHLVDLSGIAATSGPSGGLKLPDIIREKSRRAMEAEARKREQAHYKEHGESILETKLKRIDPRLRKERAQEYEDAMVRLTERDRHQRMIEGQNAVERQMRETERHKSIVFKGGQSMEGWAGKNADIIGSHHKFPKRTLAWLHGHMTQTQQMNVNRKLRLPLSSRAKAWSRLRSNLIPWGKEEVRPEHRADDPEHTGEYMDVVRTESGRMTPRSKVYSGLADHYDEIQKRLTKLAEEGTENPKMTEEEAEGVARRLHQAEMLHYSIEAEPEKPADYGPDFWKVSHSDPEKRKVKSSVPSEKYRGATTDEEEWNRAKDEEWEEQARKRREKDTPPRLRMFKSERFF